MTGSLHFAWGQGGSAPSLSPAVTLYSRIREDLRARIASGAWQPNDRIPSESTLTQQYGVSRITVRQALSDLERAQLIFKVPGKGSFVAPAKPFQELGRLQGLGEAMHARGHAVRNRVVSLHEQPATPEIAHQLDLPLGSLVMAIERVRLIDGLPVSLDQSWLPAAIGRQLAQKDLAERDIFVILERDYGLPLGYADLAIDACDADERLAGVLGIPVGTPVLHVERLTCDRHGIPLDYEHLFCRSDNFQYRLRVQRG